METIDIGGIGPNVHCNVPDLINGKLSDGVLGFSVANFLVRLCEGPNPSYKTRYAVWHDWRLSRLCPTAESLANTADAFKDLSRLVDFHCNRVCSRIWQGHDDFKPPRRKPHHPIPDLVLVDGTKANKPVEWKDVYAVVQFGDTGDASPDIDERVRAYSKLAQAARLHLRYTSPALRFSLGVAIFGTACTLVVCDRAGMLISEPFDVHGDPEVFLRVMMGLLYVDRAYLGFDTNISNDDKVLTTNDGGRWCIVERLCAPFEICAKGTVVAKVEQEVGGKVCVVKDCWKPRGEPMSEVEILEGVRGIRNVIQLEHHEEVHIMGQLDTTGTARAALSNSGPFGDLVHHRLVLSPAGLALAHFASIKELLSVIRDIVEGMPCPLNG